MTRRDRPLERRHRAEPRRRTGIAPASGEASDPAGWGIYLARVIADEEICREHWRCTIELEDFPPAAPGQFLNILCRPPDSEGWTGGAFLRRPMSIGGLRRRGRRCEIDILHRASGIGTRWLAQRRPGDTVDVLGPLGRPFQIQEDRPVAYLVGGGSGLPPLIWLAESLRQVGKRTVAFCGARSADRLPLTPCREVGVSGRDGSLAFQEFARSDTPVVGGTEDGSLGASGRIPDVFARYLGRHEEEARRAVVYACGPEPMMQAVAQISVEWVMPCQVCLERMMACGMGTCQSCVVRVRDETSAQGWRYRLCCADGPVFDARAVVWDESAP